MSTESKRFKLNAGANGWHWARLGQLDKLEKNLKNKIREIKDTDDALLRYLQQWSHDFHIPELTFKPYPSSMRAAFQSIVTPGNLEGYPVAFFHLAAELNVLADIIWLESTDP